MIETSHTKAPALHSLLVNSAGTVVLFKPVACYRQETAVGVCIHQSRRRRRASSRKVWSECQAPVTWTIVMEGEEVVSKDKAEQSWSAYKQAQVRCKQHSSDDIHNLSDLIDFCCCEKNQDTRIVSLTLPSQFDNGAENEYPLYHGPLYGVEGFPGFMFAPQAISEELQTQLAFAAVTEYCEAPHATNIDLVPPRKNEELNLPNESMWNLWKAENNFGDSDLPKSPLPPGQNQKKKYKTFRKLSWATLGYQYDWTSRAYHEGAKSSMPQILADLATIFARTSLSVDVRSCGALDSIAFTPSASIVNYYTAKSVMGGHRDDLEYALDKPVVSISLGLPAIFLLGGKTKEDTPVLPILIRPGDVVMLGGNSRLNFHGMAKIIPSNSLLKDVSKNLIAAETQQITPKDLSIQNQLDDKFVQHFPHLEQNYKALSYFLDKYRININVRQVHKDG